jgi:glycerol-3-phosphate dehydrogenase
MVPLKGVINAFSGIRCKLTAPNTNKTADFKIGESSQIEGMINLIGIESPGLTAAPAIAHHVIQIISKYLSLKKKKDFFPHRHENRSFSDMSFEEQSAHIKKDNSWGNIICRCEHVTEAEVIKALSNPLHAHTFSSIKYRCRAGMGRCQGGFCTQHIIQIMQKKLGIPITEITLNSPSSQCFVGRTRKKDNE